MGLKDLAQLDLDNHLEHSNHQDVHLETKDQNQHDHKQEHFPRLHIQKLCYKVHLAQLDLDQIECFL